MEEMQGIMALPQAGSAPKPAVGPEQMAVYEEMRQNIPPKQFGDELLSAGAQVDPSTVNNFVNELRALKVPLDTLTMLNEMIDLILANPRDYPALRREYMRRGVTEDLLPEQFDPTFFGALNMALDQMTVERPESPSKMAQGGLASLAQYGRHGDTMLAHITPDEAAMLKRMGGAGTINPVTGLPEYGNIFSNIAKAVKKFASSTVGKIITTVALGYFLGPAAAFELGVTSEIGVAATMGFVGSAGSTLLAGGNLKDAVKAGAVGGITAGALSGVSGGSFDTGSYTGGTTVGEQFDRLVNRLVTPSGTPTGPDTVSITPGGAQPGALPNVAENVDIGAPLPRGYDPIGRPEMVGPPFDAARVPMGKNTYSPIEQAQRVIGDYRASIGEIDPTTLDRGYPIGSTPQTRVNELNKALAMDSEVGRFAVPGAGDQGQFIMQGPGMGPPPPMSAGPAPDLGGPTSKAAASMAPAPSGRFDGYVSPAERFGAATPAVQQPAPGFFESAKNLDLEGMYRSLSPAARAEAGLTEAIGKAKNLMGLPADAPVTKEILEVAKRFEPGILSTYGPMAAAALVGTAALGGFKTKPAAAPDLAAMDMFNPAYARPLTFGGLLGSRGYGPRTPPQYQLPLPTRAAKGGIMSLEIGGTTYPKKQGHISGPGTGTSDSIPALLSDGEFVFTAKAVRSIGNGSRRKGAKRLYSLMKMLEGRKG